jgi:hypothetical protein
VYGPVSYIICVTEIKCVTAEQTKRQNHFRREYKAFVFLFQMDGGGGLLDPGSSLDMQQKLLALLELDAMPSLIKLCTC